MKRHSKRLAVVKGRIRSANYFFVALLLLFSFFYFGLYTKFVTSDSKRDTLELREGAMRLFCNTLVIDCFSTNASSEETAEQSFSQLTDTQRYGSADDGDSDALNGHLHKLLHEMVSSARSIVWVFS